MRGYFAIGMEGVSKPGNLGAVLRTAHAFGASFGFSVGAAVREREVRVSDTSGSSDHMPFYEWESIEELRLPQGCAVVGVELCERSVNLPSFRHPSRAAYLLGPEKGSLSPEAEALCDHVVAIPTRFCINVSLAAALVMYDRSIALGGHPERPVRPGGPLLSDVQGWVNHGSERRVFSRKVRGGKDIS